MAVQEKYQEKYNESLLEGEQSYESLAQSISSVVLEPEKKHDYRWVYVVGIGFLLTNVLLTAITYLIYMGIGIWGNNQPVGWAFDIINFVWWIGIGHAGTLISAILLLLRQQWRNSINRFAEAMTLFAVMCAGIYPMLHTGRPWVDYWLFPYPNILAMWPQFRSPLVWDVFAISTYFTVSLLFWYVGLIPDFATLRDRVRNPLAQKIYGILSWGWRGSTRHWQRYESAYLILAGLSTPLVLSVHSIVSLDFAVSIVPGWNVTIFPPYFVAGAVYAGFAMVLLLSIPVRSWYGLKELITMRHIDWMAKIMLTTGLIVTYGYVMEYFYAWYSGNIYELYLKDNRLYGPYAWIYYSLILCNAIIPQILWSPKMRRNIPVVFFVSFVVSVGMWFERFVIIPMGLHRDYLPSSWGMYYPTIWDYAMFVGTIGFFLFMMFLFIRFVPMINIFEMKDLLYRLKGNSHKKKEEILVSAKGGEH
jgi:molybdopterin-containing oxidoreductase family membrane subunit